MPARPSWNPVRILIVLSAAVAAPASVALGLWGTAWSMPRAPSPGAAHYTLAATWDGQAATGGALERPIGVAVARSGDVFVTDARLRVVRFNAAGEVLGEWGREGDGPGEFRNPVAVAVDGGDGAVYVSDYEQDRIQKFTAAGEFILEFGRTGSITAFKSTNRVGRPRCWDTPVAWVPARCTTPRAWRSRRMGNC